MKLNLWVLAVVCVCASGAVARPLAPKVVRANETVVAALRKNDYPQIRKGILAGANNWNARLPGASLANTPLFWTVRKNDAPALRLLLSRGANVNAKGYGGDTPLHTAAAVGALDATRLLIKHKARLNAKEDYGKTPLHYTMDSFSWRPTEPVARLLIQQGADVNAQDAAGKSVLLYAVGDNAAPMVALLLRSGAKVNLQDKYKNAPLHLAMAPDSHPEVVGTGIAKMLLAHGAIVDIRDDLGKTPLFWAAERGDARLTQLLLDSKANVNAKRPDGTTPLLQMTFYGSHSPLLPRVARLLMSHGANPNVQNTTGLTPLSVARKNGMTEMVDVLLAGGAKK